MSKRLVKSTLFFMLLASLLLASCTPAATPTASTAPTGVPAESTSAPAPVATVAPTTAPVAEATAAPTEPAKPQPSVGGTFVFTTNQQPDTLDQEKSALAASAKVFELINQTLITQDVNGNYIPSLAESWTVSTDGLEYTFKLKDGIKFHNGDPLKAEDIKYSYERYLDKDFVTNGSKTLNTYLKSIEVIDPLTIKFTINKPYHAVLGEFASRYYGPVSKRAVEEFGDEYGRHPVGVGPYIFKEWLTDDKIILERNPDYNWGAAYFEGANTGPWYFQTIEYRFINEYATMLAGMETGEIHMGVVQPKDLQVIEDTGLFNTLTWPAAGVQYVIMNNSKPPYNNEKLRLALTYATDRQELIDMVLLGKGIPINGPITPPVYGYDASVESAGYPYDLDKAKALIQEAGYTYDASGNLLTPEGKPFVITFAAINNENSIKQATILKSQWEKLGLKMEITEGEWATLSQEITKNNFEIGNTGTTMASADSIEWKFHSRNIGGITAKVNDPELDQLLDKMSTEVDEAQWKQDAIDVQTYIIKHAFWISLYTNDVFTMLNKNIEGAVFHAPFQRLILSNAYFVSQ